MANVAVEIRQIGADQLPSYARVPIRFTVESIFRVEMIDGGLGGLRLMEERVEPPYVKDYDAQAEEEERTARWARRFDVSQWGFFLAMDGERPVGGVTVALRSPNVNMLEERADLAVLWDIRVHPDERGRGIGTTLFRHAAAWAREKGCLHLKIETQNVNVRACRFYAKQGCELGAIHRYAYARTGQVAHEAMLLWYLDL
jgi:GNAT superfamily N-acetyltransferase